MVPMLAAFTMFSVRVHTGAALAASALIRMMLFTAVRFPPVSPVQQKVVSPLRLEIRPPTYTSPDPLFSTRMEGVVTVLSLISYSLAFAPYTLGLMKLMFSTVIPSMVSFRSVRLTIVTSGMNLWLYTV